MKKIILILYAILLFVVFVGCEKDTTFRDNMIGLLDAIKTQWEDIGEINVWENLYEGEADLLIYSEDYSEINVLKAREDTAILISFEIGDKSLNHIYVNSLLIDYMNYRRNIRIFLQFYDTHLLSSVIKPKKVNISIEDFKKGLADLSVKDWEHILKELGY